MSLGVEEGDFPGHEFTEGGVLFRGQQEARPGSIAWAARERGFHDDGGRRGSVGSAQFNAQGEVSSGTGWNAALDIKAEAGAEVGVLAEFELVGITIEQAGTSGMATVGVEVMGENLDQSRCWELGWSGGGGGEGGRRSGAEGEEGQGEEEQGTGEHGTRE